MFEIGENVLVFLVSGYEPYAVVGRVVRTIALDGAELADAVQVIWCNNAQWGKLAAGDKAVRRESQQHMRQVGTTKFAGCRDARPWAGKLPEVAP